MLSAAVHSAQQEALWQNLCSNNCLNMLLCRDDDNDESNTWVEHFL